MDTFPIVAMLLLVVAVGVAGCTDTEPDPKTSPMTAQQAWDLALEEADAWAADGEVAILTGMEIPEGHELIERQDEIEVFFAPTDHVGDGTTPVWLATAHSPERNETRFFQVLPDTIISLPEIQPPSFEPADPLEWSVGSPEAVEVALEDSAFNETVAEPLGTIVLALRMQEGEPIWRLSATPEPRAESVDVHVHGTTGNVIEG